MKNEICCGGTPYRGPQRVFTQKEMVVMEDGVKLYFSGTNKGGKLFRVKGSGRQYRAGNNGRERVLTVLPEDVEGLKIYGVFKEIHELSESEIAHFGVEESGGFESEEVDVGLWHALTERVGPTIAAHLLASNSEASPNELYEKVATMSKAELVDIPNIGEKSADLILQAVSDVNTLF